MPLDFCFFVGQKPSEVANDTTTTGGFPDTGDSAGRAFSKSSSIGRTIPGSAGETNKVNILTQLTKNTISGAAYYGTTTALYMERATGHIYKINLDGTNKIRLSNATVPKSFEATWSYKSDKMAVRYFEDPATGSVKLTVKTFLASIGPFAESDQHFGSGSERLGSSSHSFRNCRFAG